MASSWPCVVAGSAFPCGVLSVRRAPSSFPWGGPGPQHQGCLLGAPACMFPQAGSCPALANLVRLLSGFPRQGLWILHLWSLNFFPNLVQKQKEVIGFPHRTPTMLYSPDAGTL